MKAGSGVLTLSAVHGAGINLAPLTVSAGRLMLTGTYPDSDVTVGSSATLGGTGICKSLTMSSAGTLRADLTTPAASSASHLMIQGDVTLSGLVQVVDGGGFGIGTYLLAEWTGSEIDNGMVATGVPAGFGARIVTDTGANQLLLVVGTSRYWVGTSSDWSDASNWATTSGGAGGAGVPDATTPVIFDAASAQSTTLPGATSIYSLTMTGYTGILADNGQQLTVSGDAVLPAAPGAYAATGTLILSGPGTLTTNGQTLASVTVGSGAIVTASDALTLSSGLTLAANATLNPSSTVSCTTLTTGSGSTLTLGGTLTTNGDVTVAGTLAWGTHTWIGQGAAANVDLDVATLSFGSPVGTLQWEGAGGVMTRPASGGAGPNFDLRADLRITTNGTNSWGCAGTLTLANNVQLEIDDGGTGSAAGVYIGSNSGLTYTFGTGSRIFGDGQLQLSIGSSYTLPADPVIDCPDPVPPALRNADRDHSGWPRLRQ